MKFRIEERKAFKVVGKSIHIDVANGESNAKIAPFWGQLMNEGSFERLISSCGKLGVMGICYNLDFNTGNFDYMIGIEYSENTPEDLETEDIDASTWAVFDAVGPVPEAVQETFHKIHSEWFPTSGYKHDGNYELEVYVCENPDAKDALTEIWIPVKKCS